MASWSRSAIFGSAGEANWSFVAAAKFANFWANHLGGASRSRQQAGAGTGGRRIVCAGSSAEWGEHYCADGSGRAAWVADFFAARERIAGRICRAGGDYQGHSALSVARIDDRHG